mmetsp:Transcript_36394/g.32660  ORF Transcript_36394/g.32660 Transcript_36394/m.32660 type:complete len:155 (-) Transcript_36394:1007-1471(-)|eukprot:CAMPEP_0114602532 /NCGR_PEP_ID=MMETSP0125-20121206/25099_1 /TAXON_ID=485358 ORGANISM="Aristerostoma sp., Strain ATCC 50986" /NCGR_SAMPLE_ID=MMETSP0125 /ASSEMBLY_ACC=CAM_ASM_000245 /LENGTH=154 /DNA_ID=CAMNT_0001812751 /DNA_START=496 /DNA_END=960 /DNA_ORIENTATION=-
MYEFQKACQVYKRKDAKDYQLASFLNNLAITQVNCDESSSAITTYKEAIDIYKTIESTADSIELAYIYGNIGDAYLKEYDFDNSNVYFKKSIDIREKQQKPDYETIGSLYGKIVHTCLMIGKYETALPFCQRQIKIQEKLRDNRKNSQLGIAYN